MNKQNHFNSIQKLALKKMDLLDLSGLVNLKNQLVRASTDLFEIQRQFRYKKERTETRKSIMNNYSENIQSNQRNNQIINLSKVQSLLNNSDKSILKLEENVKNILTEWKKSQNQLEKTNNNAKNRNLQIPLYRVKTESNQNKLDRISKYLAALKKNIKLNTQSLGYKWKIKQFLMQDPNYLKLKRQIQQFQMRQQQLNHIIAKQTKKTIKEFIQNTQIMETSDQYKIIKVKKQKKLHISKNEINQNHSNEINSLKLNDNLKDRIKQIELSSNNSIRIQKFKQQIRQPISISPVRAKIDIEAKAIQDFDIIKKQLQKSNQTYFQMISKINQTVQKGSEKINLIRQKRKNNIQNDDIWDQLDKI